MLSTQIYMSMHAHTVYIHKHTDHEQHVESTKYFLGHFMPLLESGQKIKKKRHAANIVARHQCLKSFRVLHTSFYLHKEREGHNQ